MTRLIVNADDFGLTPGVNRAILELYKAGLVTSTSLMARAGATDEAIELACAHPSLGVGCHVVLIDGEPMLPPEQIPSLMDQRTGRFPNTIAAFLLRLFTGRVRADEIQAEAAAQIAYLQARGVRLTHVDTHKHAHVFSAVLLPVLRAARATGICAVRHPFEPEWAVRAAIGASLARVVQIAAVRPLAPRSRRILAQEGFVTTDGTIAVAGTGTLDAAVLGSLLHRLPSGTWELVTHPGYNDSDLAQVNTRLRASRDLERIALTAIREISAIDLISFADLAPQAEQAVAI